MAKDNFSVQAAQYVCYRPVYPPELYEFLSTLLPCRDTAWDCGCGNGQAAAALARYFVQVEATDISRKQLNEAVKLENINYRLAPAEKSGLPPQSVNLITVAQALHWFNLQGFYAEVQRVAAPGACLAVWCYDVPSINQQVDAVVNQLYENVLGDAYWDAERKLVEQHYQTIDFPFSEIKTPQFEIKTEWTFDSLTGYLNSWSAVQHYIRRNGRNPVDGLTTELRNGWGDQPVCKVTFPLYIRVGKIS